MAPEHPLEDNIQRIEDNIFSMKEVQDATPATVDALFDELSRQVEELPHFRLIVLANELAMPPADARHQIDIRTKLFGERIQKIAVVIETNRALLWGARMLISRVIGPKGAIYSSLNDALEELRR